MIEEALPYLIGVVIGIGFLCALFVYIKSEAEPKSTSTIPGTAPLKKEHRCPKCFAFGMPYHDLVPNRRIDSFECDHCGWGITAEAMVNEPGWWQMIYDAYTEEQENIKNCRCGTPGNPLSLSKYCPVHGLMVNLEYDPKEAEGIKW